MEDYYTKYLKYKLKYINLKNMNMTGGSDKIDLLLFKAEWCGYCKSFLPVWNSLQQMPQFNNKFNFITYEETVDKSKMKDFNIDGYPTLKYKKDNKYLDYKGPREMEHMIEFLEGI